MDHNLKFNVRVVQHRKKIADFNNEIVLWFSLCILYNIFSTQAIFAQAWFIMINFLAFWLPKLQNEWWWKNELDRLSWPDTADSECEQYSVFPQYVFSLVDYPQTISNYPCGLPCSLTSGAVEPNCVFGFANWKRILYGLCLCVDSQTNDIFKSACGYLYGWSAAISRNVEHNFEICTNELLLFFARMLYTELPHGFLMYPHSIQDDAEVLLYTQAGVQCFVQSKDNFHRRRPALFFY